MSVNLRLYSFVSCLVHSIWAQGSASVSFSSNPVYSGEPVTLTCTYGSGVVPLQSVTLDAFSGTRKNSSLWCSVLRTNTSGDGMFANTNFTGCPVTTSLLRSVSLSLVASPSLSFDYNCSATITDSNSGYPVTVASPAEHLSVLVCPTTPKILPSPVILNDIGGSTVRCESRGGTPPAFLLLTVSASNGRQAENRGNESALLVLTSPLMDWQNASATCSVTNHRQPCNLTDMSVVVMNHTTLIGQPAVVDTNGSNAVLDCSAYIASYPGVRFYWTPPPNVTVSNASYLSSPLFTVLQGQSGFFNCTATNVATSKNVIVSFVVSNIALTASTVTPPSFCDHCWTIALAIGIVVIIVIAVVLGVRCKRGHFSKGKKKPGVQPSGTDQRSENGSNRGSGSYVYDGPASWTTSTEHSNDADAFHRTVRHTQTSGDIASRKSRAQSTSDAPAQGRLYVEDIRKPLHLLVAAEGVVSQLRVRALRSTAIVEYSDHSCSLNGILEKVEQEVALCHTKFKSVALLLRPATVGVTLSEVDQAVLNFTSIKGEKGGKLRTFITHLVKICLDERGGTRMDILNYNGKSPKRLSEALTELLGIPTTVSSDLFGVEKLIDEKGGHAVVGDTYFDRNNLGEVVYAELQLPSVKPQTQSRPVEESVTYSEIRR